MLSPANASNPPLARSLPHDAEAGGGLLVAIVQLAIALGATVGGVLFDLSGYVMTFGASAAVLIVSAILAAVIARIERGKSPIDVTVTPTRDLEPCRSGTQC